jgi:hypothetical protein
LAFAQRRETPPASPRTQATLAPSIVLEARVNGSGWQVLARDTTPDQTPGRVYRLNISPTGGASPVTARDGDTWRVVQLRGVERRVLGNFSGEVGGVLDLDVADGVFALEWLSAGQARELDRIPSVAAAASATVATSIRTDLQQPAPEKSAILDVVESAQNVFDFDLHFDSETHPLKIEFDLRQLQLTGFVQDGALDADTLFDYLEHLRDNDLTEIVSLLETALGEHGTRLLIIEDNTDLEFPWEMLPLNDGEYLGAKLALVRRFDKKGVDWDADPSATCGGGVVAYVQDAAPGATAWKNALQAVGLKPRPLSELGALDAAQVQGVALVHVHSHVTFAPKEVDIKIGPLAFLQIARQKLDQGARPVVFISGCESARMRRGVAGPVGLPQRFLQQVSRAYVGTLTPIQGQFSGEFGNMVLARGFQDATGVCIPELLLEVRRERAKQAQSVQGKARTELRARMADAFAVVYYGNPHLRLALRKA